MVEFSHQWLTYLSELECVKSMCNSLPSVAGEESAYSFNSFKLLLIVADTRIEGQLLE